MPISAEKMKLYPGGSIYSREWQLIRNRILERAGWCCEGTPQYPECRAVAQQPHPVTSSMVVLTIMHMDHDIANSADDNLRAACQRCHLSWDSAHHQKNAAVTRRARKAAGDLFDV